VFKKITSAAWLALLLTCCQLAAAATLSVSATPANPTAPAAITLSITLADNPEGAAITQVEYFNGSGSLGVAGIAPFQLNLTDVAAGSYAIVARATLDSVDQPLLVSDALAVTVNAAPGAAGVYYIHTDQLNTPRAITNGAGALVWLWDSDPFGEAAPAEQPAGQAPFVNNLRFAGQYYDRETNLHYNYFRDYDPQLGRYVESDPIGLAGGNNTYAYVHGNPVSRTDTYGLRDVIVAIWTSRLVDGSVGHVFMGEMNGTTLTSQFPTPHGIEGINTTKSWADTVAAEGRDADYVYKVNVPNDGPFDAAVARVRRTPRWYAFPDGENSTQCAKAASGAMSAGGVKGMPSAGTIWPNWLNSDLLFDSVFGNQVTRLPGVPF
jgi:RHS repeat-associated protein